MSITASNLSETSAAIESMAAGPLHVLDGAPAAPEPAGPAEPAGDFFEFYGLTSNPFTDSVNPAFFFRTQRHEEACERMLLAVRLDLSFGMITGPSGTGKTLVSQMILGQLDETKCTPILVLVSPGMGKTGLLKEILTEMSVPLPEGPFASAQDMLNLLSDAVMEMHRQGKKPVFIIDEGHFLSSESLHMIRTISNIELPERKLTTCLLFAEERFLKRLQHPSYDSLRSRMYMRAELGPLNEAECVQYMQYRLLVAGRMEELFQPAALAAVYAHSGGICRNINKLGMLSLLEAFFQHSPLIEETHVSLAASKM